MILSHNKSLYDKLFIQIARMHDEVDYRKHLNAYKGQSGKWKDYPAASVGAEYDIRSAIRHHHTSSRKQDFHPLILRELTGRLGELNEDSVNYPACRNKVGHCAENYAASGVINELDPNGNLNNTQILSSLQFTKAFRPRTWKNIDWCANCHTMFD
jgi:hypothetical protein